MTFLTSIYAGKFHVSRLTFSFFQWLGYVNSLLNPVIYTIFSPDFRNAFKKMLIYNRESNNRSSYYVRSARAAKANTCQSSNKLHAAVTADPVTECVMSKGNQVMRTGKQQVKRPSERSEHTKQALRSFAIEEESARQSVSLAVSRMEQSPCPSPRYVPCQETSHSSNSAAAIESSHSNDFTSSNRTQTPSSSMSAYL